MLPRTFFTWCCLTLAGSAPFLYAQNAVHQYDARIARFESAGLTDSVLYYAHKKAQLARQADLLGLWAWIQVEIHDLSSDNPAACLRALDEALARQWRAPKDSAESEPFMYLQAYRGYYLTETGRIWPAVQAYEAARNWFERYRFSDPDLEPVETIYKPLGNHYTRLGDNEKALAVFQKALRLTPPAHTAETAGLLNNIGIAHWNSGNLSAARDNYQSGLRLPGLPRLQYALLLTGLARTLLDQNQPEAALQTAKDALKYLRDIPPSGNPGLEYRVSAHLTAGIALGRTGQFQEAEACMEKALAEAKKVFGAHSRETGKAEIAMAALLRAQGKAAAALEAANRALTAVLPGFQPRNAQENPAPSLFYEENTLFEALEEKAAAAAQQYRQSGDLQWLTLALDCHDKAWQAEMRLRQVYQYRSSKLELQKNTRAREESALNIVRTLYEKTGRPIYRQKAFILAERSKAALLRDALHDNLIRQRLAGSDARFAQLAGLRQSAAWHERQLLLHPESPQANTWRNENDALQARIKALQDTLQKAYPGIGNTVGTVDSFFILNKLPDGEILTEYFLGSLWIDVFVLSGHQVVEWRRLPRDDAFRQLTGRFLTFFENSSAILADPQGYLETACALGQILLPPETAKARRLTIVPDGILHFIPFEALVTAPPAPGAKLRSAAYLIRRQEVRYAGSLATLLAQEALKPRPERFFLGVAPLFEGRERGLPPLTAGRAEWQTLSAGGIDALTGPQADTAGLLAVAGRYRLLHFGTHARGDAQGDRPPSIELYDAALMLPDIYALNLNADLVVLSACQTGLGAEQKGEGVMSLARAFAQSGAACILSGLWTVNDRSTTHLFQDFYRALGEGLPAGAALRTAKLRYLDDKNIPSSGQSPYFWAGMVMVGADRQIQSPGDGWLWAGIGGGLALLFLLSLYFGRKLKM